MDKLSSNTINYEISKYLTQNEKYNFCLTSKRFSNICKESTNYQIGISIGDFLGLNLKSVDDEDINILREDNFHFIEQISYFLLNGNLSNNDRKNYNTYFPLGSLIKLNFKTKDECYNIIKNNNMNIEFKRNIKKNNYYSNYFKNNFKSVNALLLI